MASGISFLNIVDSWGSNILPLEVLVNWDLFELIFFPRSLFLFWLENYLSIKGLLIYPFTLFIFSVLIVKRYFPYFLQTMTIDQSTERIDQYRYELYFIRIRRKINLISFSMRSWLANQQRSARKISLLKLSWRRQFLFRLTRWCMEFWYFDDLS